MKFRQLIKWYHVIGVIGWICLILFFINMSMTNWQSGIIDYKGFIPPYWAIFLPIIWLIFEMIWMGASIESGIKRVKNIEER